MNNFRKKQKWYKDKKDIGKTFRRVNKNEEKGKKRVIRNIGTYAENPREEADLLCY